MTDTSHRVLSRDVPVLFAGVLFLLASGRWGSYLHPPGVPFYIGDLVVLAAVALALLRWRSGQLTPATLRSAPVLLKIAIVFLVWAVVRTVTRTALPLVAVRDFAPYAYAVAAPLAFLMPVGPSPRLRAWIYAALTFHAAWYIAATSGAIDSDKTWSLGPSATLFSTRPDFDGAVFGLAIAFALHHVAFGSRPTSRLGWAGIAGFVAVNAIPLGSQHSRSGLLSAFLAVGAVLSVWLLRGRRAGQRRSLARRGGVVTAAVLAAVLALLFTLPGQRLVETIVGGPGDAAATSNARIKVHEGLTTWILDSPVRTAVGIGYGPNVLARSKTSQYLEGITYAGVRSPHDYLLGTWARLGLIGAALALVIMVAAAVMAVRQLAGTTDPADVLAALVVIAIPVVAMFGVVLEAPFGAIPYFWAIGQLCAARRTAPARVPVALAGAQAQGQLLDG